MQPAARMDEDTSSSAVRMKDRDRVAFLYRVAGTIAGLALAAWTFAASAWNSPWSIGLMLLLLVGGAMSYHVMTSVARCPSCRARMVNFSIGRADALTKPFRCPGCGASAYLTEGFFWQRDFSG